MTIDSSPSLTEQQQKLLDAVYGEFRRTGEWPLSWRMELDLETMLEPNGGLLETARSLSDLIICEPPRQNDARVKLRLKGLALIHAAAIDIEAFLTLCRYAAHAYRAGETQPVQITIQGFVEFSGVDESLAHRAFHIALLDGHFWSGGSAAGFQLDNFAPRLSNVVTLAEFERLWSAYWNQNYAPPTSHGPVAPAREPAASRRLFLSHAADDAKVARYIASLITAADRSLTVFVASTPGHIQTGEDWLASIRTELRSAQTYIVLLSERSIQRPWVWFETGAAWFSERPLIPVVLPGFAKGEVPMPLGAHQSLSLASERDIEQFFADLGLAIPDTGAVVAAIRTMCKDAAATTDRDQSDNMPAT